MGDVTEADFDAWAEYVASRIDEVTSLNIEVNQARFGESQFEDIIDCDDIHLQQIDDSLRTLWNDFCADETAWPQPEK